ncbi:MAG: hypothetical protein IAF38_08625 [Bacteroidia bacterium]|nr:hypothetical protein [Bacteroidia bacterium]
MNKQAMLLPKITDGMETALITKWLKKEGEFISKGEILAEIETDKANMEIPAAITGKLLQICFPVQTSVKTGEILCFVDTDAKEDIVSSFDSIFGKMTVVRNKNSAAETEASEDEKNSALNSFEELFNLSDSGSASEKNKSANENSAFKKELCVLLNIPSGSDEKEIINAIKNLKKIS